MVELAKILVHKTTGNCLLRRRIPARVKEACVSVEFDDPVWDGLVKTVVFRGNGKKIAEFDGEIAVVPWEVLENPGPSLWFGIWGSDPDTGLQLPLIEVRIGTIEESTDPDADPGTDPTLPIWAQLKQDVEELKKGGAGGAQSDWNAAEGEPGHILNRTHWTEGGIVELLPECNPSYNEGDVAFLIMGAIPFVVGEEITVNWNGTPYKCLTYRFVPDEETGEIVVFGNSEALTNEWGLAVEANDAPFVFISIALQSVTMVLPLDGSTEVTVSILSNRETVHKLDNKYLDVDWLPGIEKKDILPLQTVETTTTTDQKYYFAHVPYNGADFWGTEISVGKKITVEVNGRPYECVVSGDAMDGFLTSAGTVNLAFHSQSIVVSTIGSQTLTLRVYIPDHNKMPVEYLPDEVGTVKTVNGTAPDENGNVEITIPDSGGNVAYDEAQNLTDEQKAQARENIGAASTEDIPTGGGISITGAIVGQTVKIAEVDENGVPTAWESVDFPSGGSGGMMELFATVPVEEEVVAVVIDLPDEWDELFVSTNKSSTLGGGQKVSANAALDFIFDGTKLTTGGILITTNERQNVQLYVKKFTWGLLCFLGAGANNASSFTTRSNGHAFILSDNLGANGAKQLKIAVNTANVTFMPTFSFYVYAR